MDKSRLKRLSDRVFNPDIPSDYRFQGFPSEVALPNHSFSKDLLSSQARHSAWPHNEIITQINATKNVTKGK